MKYKVGDKVRIKSLDWYNENKDEYGCIACGSRAFFTKMSDWCGKTLTIQSIDFYLMEEDNLGYEFTDEMIEGLVEEEEIEFTEEDKYWCDIMSESDPTTYVLPEGYIFKDENGNVINATKIVLVKKKKEYPKTYEECCEVLDVCSGETLQYGDLTLSNDYEFNLYMLLENFRKLIICRDAYWKIAGEKMGLGKPWEPDWKNEEDWIHCITNDCGEIYCTGFRGGNKILAFPTPEMRDAFYENFKVEIEFCKELL